MRRKTRLDNYTKSVLTVIALCVLALPVKAEEKVWYCQMEAYVEVTVDGVTRFKPEKFKFKVNGNNIVFGAGSYFDALTLDVNYASQNSSFFSASKETMALHFDNGKFHYADAFRQAATAISAKCDDF